MTISGAVYREGIAFSPDGAMYVTPAPGGTVASNTFSTTSLNSNVETILQTGGIPLVAPGSFTANNNGAIVLGTALNTAWPNVFMFFKAGDIAAGVPAADSWLYVTMSTTTAGTAFNNTYTTGIPTIPSSPTAFATTGAGSKTGDTGIETALQLTLPALAAMSKISTEIAVQATNNANVKTVTQVLSATTTHTFTANSVGRGAARLAIQNITTAKQDNYFDSFSGTVVSVAEAASTVDVSAAGVTLAIKLQRGTATDNLILLPVTVKASL